MSTYELGLLKCKYPTCCTTCGFRKKTDSGYTYCGVPGLGFDYAVTDFDAHFTKPSWCPIQHNEKVCSNTENLDCNESVSEPLTDIMHEPVGFVNVMDLVSCIQNNSEYTNLAICVEELAELQKALCKHIRYHTDTTRFDVLEELSDVIIVCGMIKQMMGFKCEEVQNMIDYKNDRNLRRLPKSISVYPVDKSSREVIDDFEFKILMTSQEGEIYTRNSNMGHGASIDVLMKISTFVLFSHHSSITDDFVIGITHENNINNFTRPVREDTKVEDK